MDPREVLSFEPNPGLDEGDWKKNIGRTSDGVEVFVVDGNYVRSHGTLEHTDYVEGGHHYRYKWIPENEIWIEQEPVDSDTDANLRHEIFERMLMKEQGHSYESAHDEALQQEHAFRLKSNMGTSEGAKKGWETRRRGYPGEVGGSGSGGAKQKDVTAGRFGTALPPLQML